MDSEIPDWHAETQRAGAAQNLHAAALRLMGAVPPGERFPRDRPGLEALIQRAPSFEDYEEFMLAVEPDEALPRYSGDWRVWLSPGPNGALNLRAEFFPFIRALTATLTIDGTLSEPQEMVGFGVPEEQLTDQAQADIEAVSRVRAEAEAEEQRFEELEEADELDAPDPQELLGVVAAPDQKASTFVVTTVEFYDNGVLVNYRVAKPDPTELARQREPDRGLFDAAFPKLQLVDDLGTSYRAGDWDNEEDGASVIRAGQFFEPRLPAKASKLVIEGPHSSVEVEPPG